MTPSNNAHTSGLLPSGRKHFMDEDQTFLPPALSSYSIALLNEKTSMNVNKQVKPNVTGIYDLDFPNPKNSKLKEKLHNHFSSINEKEYLEGINSYKESYLDHSEPRTTSRNNTNVSDLMTAHNDTPTHSSHYSTPVKNVMDNAAHSLRRNSSNLSHHTEHRPTPSTENSYKEEVDNSSKHSTYHLNHKETKQHIMPAVKRIKGSRRFGKLLGQNPRRVFSEPIPDSREIEQKINNMSFDLSFANKEKEMELRKRIEEQKRMNEKQNIEKRKRLAESLIKQLSLVDKHRPFPIDENEFQKILTEQDKADSFKSSTSREPLKDVPTNNFAFRKPKTPKLVPLEPLATRTPKEELQEAAPRSESDSSRETASAIQAQSYNSIKEFQEPKDSMQTHPEPLQLPDAIRNSISSRRPEQTKEDGSSKKKMIVINNIQYEKLELVGRGGTSKVYKVKCINDNRLYAIKKVTFDQFDLVCVKGFKGEIDLLLKLKDNNRVVQLIDYAIGEGALYLIMECGEIDLSHVLHNKISKCNELDLSFVKFYSTEMFKCVQTVHEAEIVHSDLKPANFLFVKGILKIIDFGIANAVPDHTANIYRDAQIGTPNYMAPEAIVDVNDTLLPVKDDSERKNTWKVGKPSDVWSCGCIIYQMIYGKPPYGKYQGNQRIMAIINPQVKIQFPSKGLGGVKVPTSAIELMQNCLSRFPGERWTITQCLNSDFLKPKVVSEGFVRDLVHLAVNFGYNNRVNGTGIITADVYDKLVDTVLKQIEELNFS